MPTGLIRLSLIPAIALRQSSQLSKVAPVTQAEIETQGAAFTIADHKANAASKFAKRSGAAADLSRFEREPRSTEGVITGSGTLEVPIRHYRFRAT